MGWDTTAERHDLTVNRAGDALIAQCMAEQQGHSPRGVFQRVLGISPWSSRAYPWYLGVEGERRVAEQLTKLRGDWLVLHSVPIGNRGSDIDHVVFGPPGLFVVNTKRHVGKRINATERSLFIGGTRTDHLRNSRYEAERVRKLLAAAGLGFVPVYPVLAITGADEVRVSRRLRDVTVIRGHEVRLALRRRRALTAEQIAYVADDLRRPEFWSPRPFQHVDEALRNQFEAIKREHLSAMWVRIGWVALACVVACSVTLRLLGK